MELLQGPSVNTSCQGLARCIPGRKGPARISSWTGSLSGTLQPSSPLIPPGLPGNSNPCPPVAAFSASPLSGQFPLAVQFTDQSSMAPITWQWDFGDGTPNSTLQSPAHAYASPGSYTVTLTVSNAYGTSTIQKTDYITVTPPPPFLEGWSYRKLHTLAGSPSGVLTDYQVRFKVYNTTGIDAGENVYLGSQVKPDFSDIRFTTEDNTLLPTGSRRSGPPMRSSGSKSPPLPHPGPDIPLLWEPCCLLTQ